MEHVTVDGDDAPRLKDVTLTVPEAKEARSSGLAISASHRGWCGSGLGRVIGRFSMSGRRRPTGRIDSANEGT